MQASQKEVNDEAQANFEKEMQQHKDYFRKHGVWASIYTDKDLADPDELFEDIKRYLVPTRVAHQLEIHALDELRRFKPWGWRRFSSFRNCGRVLIQFYPLTPRGCMALGVVVTGAGAIAAGGSASLMN
jgi:hypothetical protein